MSGELPSHGTGYAESEAFMDVVVLFADWMGDTHAPNFDDVRRRLRESFNDSELRNLDVVARTLVNLIEAELTQRHDNA